MIDLKLDSGIKEKYMKKTVVLGGREEMKAKLLVALIITGLVMGACGTQEENHSDHQNEMMQEVIVEIQTAKELPVGEEVILSARVTQGEEAVNDADHVEFEVWESGLIEDSVKIDGVLTEDGVYEAPFTFEHDGVYYMFAHTTARDLHIMPKQELIVGSPDMEKVLPDNSDNSMEHDGK